MLHSARALIVNSRYLCKLETLVVVLLCDRQALNEAKRHNHALLERVQAMQSELSDSEVRRAELEGQIRQSHHVGFTFVLN